MVDPKHPRLGLSRQCRLVSISRSSFYYEGNVNGAEKVYLRGGVKVCHLVWAAGCLGGCLGSP